MILTRPGCHLCVQAREVIDRVAESTGASVAEVDVVAHPELLDRYGEQLPVTFVDGRQHDYWRVDADRLRRALTR